MELLSSISRLAAGALAVAALAPPLATADQVYHSEHLNLEAVGGAPLRSGFVENIKAEGPRVYAHEIYALNGVRPNATYTVTRDFFVQDPDVEHPEIPQCEVHLFDDVVGTLGTNEGGNARGDLVVDPAIVAGFTGTFGVTWTVRDAWGTVAYRTNCTLVTLD